MPKRDLEVVRQLLFRAELVPLETEEGVDGYVSLSKEVSDDEAYHLLLMKDAGLIEGAHVNHGVFRITNSGHDYLDAIRDESIWNKAKDGAAKVGGMTLGMIKDLAIAYLKQEAAEKLGIQI